MKKAFVVLLSLSLLGMLTLSASAENGSENSDDSVPPVPSIIGTGANIPLPSVKPGRKPPVFKVGTGAVFGTGGMFKPEFKPFKNGSGALLKEELKAMKEKAQQDIKANREKQKENLEKFREENKGGLKGASGSLTDEQKSSLKTLAESHKAEMDALFAELKAAKGDQTKTEEIFAKIEAARATHLAQVKAIVGVNAELSRIVDDRTKVFEENRALREDNREKRDELKVGIEDKVAKYKGLFIEKIEKKLAKLNPEQIQKIIDAVDKQIAKVEANTKLSDENKAKLKAQLVGLREVLEDRLDTNDSAESVSEIESMIESFTE